MKKAHFLFLLSLFICCQSIEAREPETTYLDNVAQYVTPIGAPFIGLLNVKSKHPFRERLAVTVTALAFDEIMVQSLKHTISSERPDKTDNHSFPSGHTSIAFVGAEIIREEYGWKYGIGAYLWGAGVGVLRTSHHRHRLADVVGGAAMGVLSARLAYLLLPFERKIFKWDDNISVSITPQISNNLFGMGMMMFF